MGLCDGVSVYDSLLPMCFLGEDVLWFTSPLGQIPLFVSSMSYDPSMSLDFSLNVLHMAYALVSSAGVSGFLSFLFMVFGGDAWLFSFPSDLVLGFDFSRVFLGFIGAM